MRLFVGQIPREWSEHEVHALFANYGDLIEVNILRQPDTLQSKGCAFVSYTNDESALRAIEALHDKYSPSEGRKIQVRDSAAPRVAAETGRLYCSNLAESTTGNQLFELFSTVGRVLSVSILVTPYNQPKCSCLVEMATKADAQAVIDKFHMQHRLPNAPFEISVAWARNTGSKNKQATGPGMLAPTLGYPPGGYAPLPGAQQQQQQQQAMPPAQMYPPPPAMYSPAHAHAGFFAAGPPQASAYYPTIAYHHYESADQVVEEEKSDEGYAYSPMQSAPLPMPPPGSTALTASGPPQPMPMEYPAVLHQPYVLIAVPWGPHVPPQSPLVATKRTFSRRRSSSSLLSNPSPSRYREGPVGANLFVKNFPLDWENKDLQQLFEPFGDILSCNVFRDKLTGKSRGFGFVSYNTKEQAANAILDLHGRPLSEEHKLHVEIKLKQLPSTSSSLSVLDSVDAAEEEEGYKLKA